MMARGAGSFAGRPARRSPPPTNFLPQTSAGFAIVPDMDHEVSASDYAKIEALIASDDSPVGIDAKKTHIIIISKLLQIEERLAKLEHLVARKDT